MTKKGLPLKLGTQFTIAAFIALVISMLVFLAGSSLGGRIVRNDLGNPDYVEKQINRKVDEFQAYVEKNHVKTTDSTELSAWVSRERNVVLAVYDESGVVFDSTLNGRNEHHKDSAEPPMQSHRSTYSIDFEDETAMVELFVLVEFKYMVAVNYIAIAVALLVFFLVYTTFIRRKVKYITELEQEVNILEAGDMNYTLTVKGNDELSYLARSIDNMRLSVIERREEEEKARLANHKLVTAMSHDLRTPLTILIGFLEIIDGKKYSGEEELNTYITKTKNKAYQIKELSDKIFEYFFAFDIKESELNKEPYDTEIINAMIEDYNFNLTDKGYTVNYTACDTNAKVMLDVKVFGRVFGNIFSNILKYADKEKPVDICCMVEGEELVVNVSNYILPKNHKEESTNIGLEVCKNIVKQHSGEFTSEEKDGIFSLSVRLPIVKNK